MPIGAIARARRWQEHLKSGESASIEGLAHAVGIDRTYVGRMPRLASPAADVVEAVLRGDEPEVISLAKLRKNLPVRSEEQQALWEAQQEQAQNLSGQGYGHHAIDGYSISSSNTSGHP